MNMWTMAIEIARVHNTVTQGFKDTRMLKYDIFTIFTIYELTVKYYQCKLRRSKKPAWGAVRRHDCVNSGHWDSLVEKAVTEKKGKIGEYCCQGSNLYQA